VAYSDVPSQFDLLENLVYTIGAMVKCMMIHDVFVESLLGSRSIQADGARVRPDGRMSRLVVHQADLETCSILAFTTLELPLAQVPCQDVRLERGFLPEETPA
jgi:hypothetical protein